MIGTTVGRYTIEEKLGSGAMGEVYLGVEKNFIGRRVAVKFLKIDLDQKEHIRFEKEAKILASLEHPTIIPLNEYNKIETPLGNQPYLIMPLMAQTMRDIFNKGQGALPPDQILEIVDRTAVGLDYIHGKGIIHRDLKPSNIFFDDNFDAYLGDFGIAKMTDSETQLTSGLIGTPHYMSPEQIKMDGIDRRADIYAFGCVVFEMLTGSTPFGELESFFSIMSAHQNDYLPPVSSINKLIPAEVDHVIDKAVAKNKEFRYPTATEFAQDLRAAIDKEVYVTPSIHSESFNASQPSISADGLAVASNNSDNLEAQNHQSLAENNKTIWEIVNSYRIGIGLLAALIALWLLIDNFILPPIDPPPTTPIPIAAGYQTRSSIFWAGTPTSTFTPTPTDQPTHTPTATPTPTQTALPTPTATPVIEIASFAVINAPPDALIDSGSGFERVPNSGILSLDSNQTLRLVSNEFPVELQLANRTYLVLDSESEVTFKINDGLAANLLDGEFVLLNANSAANVQIGGNLSAGVESGELGITYDAGEAVVSLDCLFATCQYAIAGNPPQQFEEGESIRFDLTQELIEADLPADIGLYDHLGRTIRQPPSVAEGPSATSTPFIVPIFETFSLGTSVEGNSIEAVRLGKGEEKVILVGGLHSGFAPNTVQVVNDIKDYYLENINDLPDNITLYIIPNINPDSIVSPGNILRRLNGNGVDLNRNWDCRWSTDPNLLGNIIPGAGGTQPVSEPESKAFKQLLEESNPDAVIFWGATVTFGGFISPGFCDDEPEYSTLLAKRMAEKANYKEFIGDQLLEANKSLTGDISNWLNKVGIPSVFILLYEYEEYDFGKDLLAINAAIEAVSSGEVSADPLTNNSDPQPTTAAPTPNVSTLCPNLSERASQFTESIYPQYIDQLGCPVTQEISTVGVYQLFEGGTLVWREDTDQVYFLRNNGTYHIESMRQVTDEGNYPWSDRLRGAFGYIWHNYADLQGQLGEPLADEEGANGFAVQNFQTGTIFTYVADGVPRTSVLSAKTGTWTAE